jgi:hypothetical protein
MTNVPMGAAATRERPPANVGTLPSPLDAEVNSPLNVTKSSNGLARFETGPEGVLQ